MIHTTTCKMGKQQGPTTYQREIHSASVMEKACVRTHTHTHTHTTEWAYCILETNIIL